MDKTKLYAMKLHDSIMVTIKYELGGQDKMRVTKVHDGWLYGHTAPVFVPDTRRRLMN